MSFKEHLRKMMITWPSLFPTAIRAYDHLFMTIGNGYEWINGELVYEDNNRFFDSTEDAINNVVDDMFNMLTEKYNDEECKLVWNSEYYINKTKRFIKTILHVDELIDDLSVPILYDETEGVFEWNKFRFYGLSKYSKISNIPEDIKYDWLKAIKNFIDILDKNRNKFVDKENLFDKIKEQVNYLINKKASEFVNSLL